MPQFIFEVDFELLPGELVFPVTFTTAHPQARVESVVTHRERRDDGTYLRTVASLLVRDFGNPAHATHVRQVIVVRRYGRITEVPSMAGKLITTFRSGLDGEEEWYVFDQREPKPAAAERPAPAPPSPRAAGSGRQEPAPRPSASPAPSSQKSPEPAADDWLSRAF